MATEKSEPKTLLIIKVGVGCILSLVVIRLAMVSYFDNVAKDIRAEQTLEGRKPEMSTVNQASSALTQGPMPIDKAMQMLANASPNRQGLTGVEPQQPTDMKAAMLAVTQCWQAMGCDGGGLVLPADVDGGSPSAQNADAAVTADAAADAAKAAQPAPRPNPRPNPPNPPPPPH
jgi:hypothetical protein